MRPEGWQDHYRWISRTRHRALEQLAREHPARFAVLVAEEREKEPDPFQVAAEVPA